MKKRTAAWLILTLCLVVTARGQWHDRNTGILQVLHYSTGDGLRQSMVKQVIQDSTGLVWMSTGDGLHCFDGKTFTDFRVPGKAPFTRFDNLMRNIALLPDQSLLISTAASILRFDRSRATFRIIYQEQGAHPVLFPTLYRKKPLAWIYDRGYFFILNDSLQKMEIDWGEYGDNYEKLIPSTAVLHDSGSSFILAGHEVLILERSGSEETSFACTGIIQGKNNWTAMSSGPGSLLYLASGNRVFSVSGDGSTQELCHVPAKAISELFFASDGNLWIASSEERQLFRFTWKGLERLEPTVYDGRHTDQPGPLIICISEDRQKNIWLCTDGNGVMEYQPGNVSFDRAPLGFTRRITGYNNRILISTFGNGLWITDPDLSHPVRFMEGYSRKNHLLDLVTDTHRRLWLVSENGLDIFGPTGEAVKSFPFQTDQATIFKMGNDTVLVSTSGSLYTFSTGRDPLLLDREVCNLLTALVIDDKTSWAGTAYGLFRIENLPPFSPEQFNNGTRISVDNIKALALIDSSIWAGSQNGICIYNRYGKKQNTGPSLQKWQNEIVYSILPDSLKRIWFSSNLGIACYSPAEEKLVTFSIRNNLQSSEFNSGASYRSESGQLYFGGINGVNAICPEKFRLSWSGSKPFLTRLLVSDTLYCPGIPGNLPELRIFRVNPSISGSVASGDLTGTDKQAFSFRLLPVEKEWSSPSENASFSYRNLPHGKYSLEARYMDAFNNWSPEAGLVSFYIKPPFWETWWFYPLITLFLTTLLAASLRYRQKSIHRKRIIELEYQNAVQNERLRISRDLHDELGSGLSMILLNSSLAQGQPEKTDILLSTLSGINRRTRELYDSMNSLIWLLKNESPGFDRLLPRLREMIADTCEEAGITYTITFPEKEPEKELNRDYCRQIYLVVKEAVNNIIRHADAGSLRFEVREDNGSLLFEISDDGRGFDSTLQSTDRNGLENMKNRISRLSGDFRLVSTPGKGTVVAFSVPLENGADINTTKV